jgi:hypothetical protein
MKKLLLSLAICGVAFSSQGQTWTENFDAAGLPANWVMIDADGLAPNSGLGTGWAACATQAWIKKGKSATDSCYGTTSWFTSAATADRWLISKSFTVNNANTYLFWQDFTSDANYPDNMEIMVSTTAGTTVADFGTTPIYNQSGTTGGWAKHGVSLGAYNGQTIRVAFRDNSNDKFVLYIDNAGTEVPPSNDLALTAIAPLASSPLAYGTVGAQMTIKGAVKNNGFTTVTSYVVKYQQGANAPVAQTITANIPVYGTSTFTLTTPYTIPSMGVFPIKVWVEFTGDMTHTNDTLNTTFRGVANMPTKRLTFEEATGTWCGWCPRGAVYMDSMYSTHPMETNLIAVHNSTSDPMQVPAYDAGITATPGFSGFPGAIVDRREVLDPSQLFDAYNNEHQYFGFAAVNFTHSITGANLSATVTVKPSLDLSGDYRLALVITEDHVHGTTSGYDQHNYYSSTSQNLPLNGAGHLWQNEPNPVPHDSMYYMFVARAIVPSFTGAAGSLPATMTNGTNYTYTFNTALDPSWNKNNLRYAVLLLDNSTGNVLNSASTTYPEAVKDVELNNNVNIYPNPATDYLNVSFELNHSSNVQVQIIDALGQVVNQVANNTMESGVQNLNVNTANLTSGVYFVKIQTENNSLVQKFTIAK